MQPVIEQQYHDFKAGIMSDKICMPDKERFCMNKLWHLNFLAPTFWNWRQNLIPGDFSGANIFVARAAPTAYSIMQASKVFSN